MACRRFLSDWLEEACAFDGGWRGNAERYGKRPRRDCKYIATGSREMRSMFDELASKEVVNMSDGRRLGSIVDMELETTEGRVLNVIVPGPPKLMGLVRGEREFSIPWESIVKIGDDVVLVDVGAMDFDFKPR